MSNKIHTDKAPAAIGPYSQAVTVGSLVFTSGQIALDPETGAVVEGGIAEQTHRVCSNLEAVLAAAGASTLADMADFSAFNEVYGQYFSEKPARSCVAVKALPKGVLVEVEVIAEKE